MVYLLKDLSSLTICKCHLALLSSVQENKFHLDLCSDKWRVIRLSQTCLHDWDCEGLGCSSRISSISHSSDIQVSDRSWNCSKLHAGRMEKWLNH